jgi:DNA mismatch repair protein MutS
MAKKIPASQQVMAAAKQRHPGVLILVFDSDFYECFGEDARVVSRLLEVPLIGRAGTPVCKIPHEGLAQSLAVLIRNGHRVAICDPANKEE